MWGRQMQPVSVHRWMPALGLDLQSLFFGRDLKWDCVGNDSPGQVQELLLIFCGQL